MGIRRRSRLAGRSAIALTAMLTALAGAGAATGAEQPSVTRHARFLLSAAENANFTQVRLPLYLGTSHGETVSFVVTEASDPESARLFGANFSPRLANAKGSPAVQQVSISSRFSRPGLPALALARLGAIEFPATVDFSPQHLLEPGPTGFPPSVAVPGAVGEPGYSPLIELPDGTVLNAPHVANDSGTADKVLSLDRRLRSVVYQETEGRYEHKTVHYVSFDASDAVAAAIEDVTFAPALQSTPLPARQQLFAFVNGQTGPTNPERQGLNSTLLDRLDPLNILAEVPLFNEDIGSLEYSPLWGIRFAQWSDAVVAAGGNVRQTDFDDVLDLQADGLLMTRFAGFLVNCPVVSIDIPVDLPTALPVAVPVGV